MKARACKSQLVPVVARYDSRPILQWKYFRLRCLLGLRIALMIMALTNLRLVVIIRLYLSWLNIMVSGGLGVTVRPAIIQSNLDERSHVICLSLFLLCACVYLCCLLGSQPLTIAIRRCVFRNRYWYLRFNHFLQNLEVLYIYGFILICDNKWYSSNYD